MPTFNANEIQSSVRSKINAAITTVDGLGLLASQNQITPGTDIAGQVAVAQGGTGGATAASARTNLGLDPLRPYLFAMSGTPLAMPTLTGTVRAGTPTLASRASGAYFYTGSAAEAAIELATITSGANFNLTACVWARMTTATFAHFGIYARGSGGQRNIGPRHDDTFFVTNWNASYAFASNGSASANLAARAAPCFLRLQRISGALNHDYSFDGEVWTTLSTTTISGTIADVTSVGLMSDDAGQGYLLGWSLT